MPSVLVGKQQGSALWALQTPRVCCRLLRLPTALPRRTLLAQSRHRASGRKASLCRAVLSELPKTSTYSLSRSVDAGAHDESELGWRTGFADVYNTRESIGSGAFGQVRLGIHKASGLEVAVKSLPKVRGKLTRARTLEKIRREMAMMRRLQSAPGAVQLIGCFEDSEHAHIVMEVCRGGDLRKFVEKHGTLSEPMLAHVALRVLAFIKNCEDMGVVYADVKPANFCLVDERPKGPMDDAQASAYVWNLRAVDFGSSQRLEPGDRIVNRSSGTCAFMAPEVYAKDFGHKADMWSLGVMLYWLTTQQFPFWPGGQPPMLARVEDSGFAVANAPITFDFGAWLRMSPEGLDFVQRCMSRDEAARMGAGEALQHPWIARFVDEQTRFTATLPLL